MKYDISYISLTYFDINSNSKFESTNLKLETLDPIRNMGQTNNSNPIIFTLIRIFVNPEGTIQSDKKKTIEELVLLESIILSAMPLSHTCWIF